MGSNWDKEYVKREPLGQGVEGRNPETGSLLFGAKLANSKCDSEQDGYMYRKL
jgi:hypothetical protein